MQPIVIIDGNNLAHEKYNLQGKPVTIRYDRAIILDLSLWAKRQREACAVDLFLDPRMALPESTGRVFVHVAYPGDRADAHIKDYVRHCVLSQKACILITDDGELTDYANQQGVLVIPVKEFIKLPKFLDLIPADFEKESFPYLKNISPAPDLAPRQPENAARIPANPSAPEPQKINKLAASELLDLHHRTYQGRLLRSENAADRADENSAEAGAALPVTKAMLRLNLETWPVEDGYQFLTHLICSRHKQEYQSLLGKPEQAASSDLRTYYHFVVELCGAEPDFYARGVTLMDNLRLKLMKVYPDALALAELDELFKDNPGFRHKIKVHNGKSIELFESTI
jgi:hypothetical protein